jgi:single-strand DNA-binding protein
MSGVNKVILVGNLGADPELKTTTGSQQVAQLRIAVNESWTDKAGARQERTEWVRVVAWGKLADLCSQYLAKGRQVYIEGRLQTREWTDKENRRQFTTEVVAQNVVFLGGGRGATADAPGGWAESDGQDGAAPIAARAQAPRAARPAVSESEIPF